MSNPPENPLERLLIKTFDYLDERVASLSRGEDPLHYTFWRSGVASPAFVPIHSHREIGLWQANADLGKDGRAQLSVSLQGGHTRVGLFLPHELLSGITTHGIPLMDTVARSFDNQPASMIRHVGNDVLFDRIFREAPFSAEFIAQAMMRPDIEGNILAFRLAWMTVSIWEAAWRTVGIRQDGNTDEIVVVASRPLPASVIFEQNLPISIGESFEFEGAWATLVRTDLSAPDLFSALRGILPEASICTMDEHRNAVKNYLVHSQKIALTDADVLELPGGRLMQVRDTETGDYINYIRSSASIEIVQNHLLSRGLHVTVHHAGDKW